MLDLTTFANLFNLLSPSLMAVIVVYATYKYGIRHKLFEEKQEYNKKIRIAIANLILIYNEFIKLQKFINDKDPKNEIIHNIPEIAKEYLKIDNEKIKKLKDAYDESLSNIKEIDAILYIDLYDLLVPLNEMIEEIMMPLIKDEHLSVNDRDTIFIPLVNQVVGELEEEIKNIAAHLPKKEKKDINELILENKKSDNTDEIPQFILTMINKVVLKENPITKEEMNILINNPTVKWIIKKFFNGEMSKLFQLNSKMELLKAFILLCSGNTKNIEKIADQIDGEILINSIEISEEEEKLYLRSNRTFYILILAIIKKFHTDIPYALKSALVRINNGDISLREKLAELKLPKENEKVKSDEIS